MQLKIGENAITSDMQEINKEIEKFYSELLETNLTESQQINSEQEFESFTEGLDIPKVPSSAQSVLESDLTLDEIQSALKSFQKNKSPGEDGFSKEFYEAFFDILGNHLLDSYNEAFIKGQLSVSQRRGVITLIPKEDSCLIELANWRPITLLNVDYNILTKTIAKRIESVLPSIIHSDQSGFVKGRYIGQNVRLLCDIINGVHRVKENSRYSVVHRFQEGF